MRSFLLGLVVAIGSLASNAYAVDDCMGNNDFAPYHAGNQLVPTSTFLPAGSTADFILKAPFDPKATYFVKFDAHYLPGAPLGGAAAISVAQMPENSPYIKSGLANKSDSLARVDVPAALGSHWQTAHVRIYGCENANSPTINSRLDMKVSSGAWSTPTVVLAVILLYLAAAFAFRTELPTGADAPTGAVAARQRFLDPVVMTAGIDGKGSLSKLQILFFTVIVFALLLFILLRSGELSDLSQTVLLLLGIAAVGSTAAKGADLQQNRLDFENWEWLRRKNWIGVDGLARSNEARWSDILTTDGEFDIYRYQSCIFSLVVGGALLVVGVSQLASFEIPTTLLGVLGLSQVVYVAGKLVSPPAMADLNKAIKNLRDLEKAVQAAAVSRGVTDVKDSRISTEVQKYREAAAVAADMFNSVTSLERPTNLEPSLT